MSASGHRAKAQSISGWTAFDLKKRQKQQGLDNHDSNPYPSLSGLTATKSLLNKNESLLDKPFSSLLVPSIDFPRLKDAKNRNLPRQLPASTSSSSVVTSAVQNAENGKIKDLHPWADESLIQDVLAGVNNNAHEALSLLEAMVIVDDDNEVDKKKEVEESRNDIAPPDVSFSKKENMISFINGSLGGNHKQLLDTIKSLPIEPEPEWGEDDVYLIYRKDAIRMMRSASRHSKSANDAYIRGDHAAARDHSVKAQQEWAASERLNAKAAKEILNLRNCQNDVWTLDLHGLHAAEAVEALREHLMCVESLVSPKCLAAQEGVVKDSGMSVAASVQPNSRQRMALLQVITGKGNHSRGSAALPSAIRNFLSDNGYHLDESRPGVMMVRPKFRLR